MRMRTGTVVAVVAIMAFLLAGCSQSPTSRAREDSAIAQADQAAAGVDVQATDTTGVIRGVVVDEAIRPVGGVLVAIEGTGLNATTNEAGGFGFEGLQAGTYFLLASHPRFRDVRLGVLVEAANQEPEPVRVVMTAIPTLAPSVELFKATLFIAFSAPLFGSLSPSDAGLDGDDRATFEMRPNATVVQAEITWDASTPTAEHLRMYGSATEQSTPMEIKSAVGATPLWVRLNGTSEGDVADGFYFGIGSLSRSPTSTEVPDATGMVVVNQQLEGYATAFYNFLPRDGWLFVRDGDHPLPP